VGSGEELLAVEIGGRLMDRDKTMWAMDTAISYLMG